MPTSRDPSTPRLDPVGALLSMVGLSLLLWTIIQAPERGWGSTATIAGFVGSIAVIGAFAFWETHRDQPMLDLTFFRNPRFTVANVAVTMAFFAIAGAVFIVTQMLQFILGYNPLEAGIGLLPVAIMFMVFAPVAPRVVERFGSKRLVGFGLIGGACGLLILATVHADSSYVHIALGLVCMSGGMSMAMPSATESIMGSVPKEKAGVGSAMNDTTRQAGGALGVAVLGSVLASGFTAELGRRLSELSVERGGRRAVEAVDRCRDQLRRSARRQGRSHARDRRTRVVDARRQPGALHRLRVRVRGRGAGLRTASGACHAPPSERDRAASRADGDRRRRARRA